MAALVGVCETAGCGKDSKLWCPTCIKLELPGASFCSQECFKSSWTVHKGIHKKAKEAKKLAEYVFSGTLRPYLVTPKRHVPARITRPDYADVPGGQPSRQNGSMIESLNDEEIGKMRVACRLAREVLDVAANAVDVGVTTDEIDRLVHEASVERGCYPTLLNYHAFPKSCWTSVNEVACHGIPDSRPLENGDICNVAVAVYHGGFHGGLNETFFVGDVDEESKNLVKVTYLCLKNAIKLVKPGVRYSKIGDVIQKGVQTGYSVVKDYNGHGIHKLYQTVPEVPNHRNNEAEGIMKPGQTFTMAPIISEGRAEVVTWPDGFTTVNKDGNRSAQFEETLLVTKTGVEVLTAREENHGQPHFMDV